MRSAILIFLTILAFATTPARAQGTWLETRLIKAICSDKTTPAANTDRLAKRLNLTDPQRAALKDLADASASADASARCHLRLRFRSVGIPPQAPLPHKAPE